MANTAVPLFVFFFFNDTATTEIYTLSLHDALPILNSRNSHRLHQTTAPKWRPPRSEEHTSELQSPCNLVCRLLLEKKKASIERFLTQAPRLNVFRPSLDDVAPRRAHTRSNAEEKRLAGSSVRPSGPSIFFNNTATTEFSTLSLPDALPI